MDKQLQLRPTMLTIFSSVLLPLKSLVIVVGTVLQKWFLCLLKCKAEYK